MCKVELKGGGNEESSRTLPICEPVNKKVNVVRTGNKESRPFYTLYYYDIHIIVHTLLCTFLHASGNCGPAFFNSV